MGFLAPVWLMLGAAAAIPLLVHLLRRRSAAAAEFPAARYLLRAEREHSRSIRLRNLLLMILRVLAVLLVAMAAARPVGELLTSAGPGHAPTSLALLLDNSASTGLFEDGTSAFDRLRHAARAVVEGATGDDRIHLVTADGELRSGDRASALAVLEQLAPIPAAGDLGAAMRAAAGAARSDEGRAPAMVILTDGQRTSWRETVALPDAVPVVLAVLDSSTVTNRAVLAADPRPTRWVRSGRVDIRLQARDSAPVRVVLGSPGQTPRTVARDVAPPAGALTVRVTPPDTGWLIGRAEIDSDEMPVDDARHFAVWAGPAPRVRVLPGAGPFVQSAVAAVQGSGAVGPGDEVRVLSADEIGSPAGPMLVLAPAGPTQLGRANAALARVGIPWRFGPERRGGTARIEDLEFAVGRRYDLVPTVATVVDTLAHVNGRPWAVAGEAGGSRYVVISSPLVPDATDLPLRAGFVPWLASLLTTRLTGPAGGVRGVATGQRIAVSEGVDSLVGPNGAVPVSGRVVNPAQPGVYLLREGGRTAGALVVNVEERESVIDRLGAGEVAARIRGSRVRTVDVGEGLARVAFAAGGSRSLIAPVLVAALLVLGIEAFATAFSTRGTA